MKKCRNGKSYRKLLGWDTIGCFLLVYSPSSNCVVRLGGPQGKKNLMVYLSLLETLQEIDRLGQGCLFSFGLFTVVQLRCPSRWTTVNNHYSWTTFLCFSFVCVPLFVVSFWISLHLVQSKTSKNCKYLEQIFNPVIPTTQEILVWDQDYVYVVGCYDYVVLFLKMASNHHSSLMDIYSRHIQDHFQSFFK